MEEIPAGGVKLRHDLANMSLNQSTPADLMAELGDRRELKSILRSIRRMAGEKARLSGEMHVILTLLLRQHRRACRLANQASGRRTTMGA